MRKLLFVTALACATLATGEATAQIPTLPDGAQTHWVVNQTQEVAIYLTFDPAKVKQCLPKFLRFITVKELATSGVQWATDYLTKHPAHDQWGISFIEIVRMGTFLIDGRSPNWPKNGAAALWVARVAPSDQSVDLGPGKPFLSLEFWLPDRAYVAYMRQKGHYATYGDVRLFQDSQGKWRGSVKVKGLTVVAECIPTGPIAGGSRSSGMQVFFPPLSSGIKKILRVAFAGHSLQDCSNDSSWILRGTHPLVGGTLLPPSVYEFGYDLVGGTYIDPFTNAK